MLKKIFLVILAVLLSSKSGIAQDNHNLFKEIGVDTLVFTDANDFSPYCYIKNNKAQGILVDYWKEWAKKYQIPIKFNLLPWSQVLENAQNGNKQIIMSVSRRSRPYLKYSSTYAYEKAAIIYNKSMIAFKDLESFDDTIAICAGDFMDSMIIEKYGVKKFKYYNSYHETIEAVSSNKVKLSVVDTGLLVSRSFNLDNLVIKSPDLDLNSELSFASTDINLINVIEKIGLLSSNEVQLIEEKWNYQGYFFRKNRNETIPSEPTNEIWDKMKKIGGDTLPYLIIFSGLVFFLNILCFLIYKFNPGQHPKFINSIKDLKLFSIPIPIGVFLLCNKKTGETNNDLPQDKSD